MKKTAQILSNIIRNDERKLASMYYFAQNAQHRFVQTVDIATKRNGDI